MDEFLSTLGIEKRVVAGRRITDAETLSAAKMMYAGLLNTDIVSALTRHGCKGAGLTGLDGGIVTAVKRPTQKIQDDSGRMLEVDFQYVGDITSINPAPLNLLIDNSIIPVVCSLGGSEQGEVYNVNADTVASKIAQALKAEKLLVLSNVPGVMRKKGDPSTVISYADIASLDKLVADGTISGGMLPKVTACIDAVRNGVVRTHIVDGGKPNSLLIEIFVNQGCGTMIVNEKEMLKYEDEIGGNR